MSVKTPSPTRRDYLRKPVGRNPVSSALDRVIGRPKAMSFLMSTQADFSPDDIASLAHWYDATELTGFNDGESVGTWPDEEGSDDLTQGTGSKQPTYQTGVIGGNPIVRFDGADDLLQGAWSATLSQPTTQVVVVQAQTALEDASEQVYSGDDSTNRQTLGTHNDSNGNDWFYNAGSTVDSGTAEDADPHILTARFDGADSTLRLDGGQIASGDPGSNAIDGLTLGASDADVNFGDFDIGEHLTFDAALSTADRDDVESHLSDKWGVTLS